MICLIRSYDLACHHTSDATTHLAANAGGERVCGLRDNVIYRALSAIEKDGIKEGEVEKCGQSA